MVEKQKTYYFFSQKAANYYSSVKGRRNGKMSKNFINGKPYTECRTGVNKPYSVWDDWVLIDEGYGREGVTTEGYW